MDLSREQISQTEQRRKICVYDTMPQIDPPPRLQQESSAYSTTQHATQRLEHVVLHCRKSSGCTLQEDLLCARSPLQPLHFSAHKPINHTSTQNYHTSNNHTNHQLLNTESHQLSTFKHRTTPTINR